MKKYTLGFIFDLSLSKVLLIQKQRPEWQKGRYNGIGGKIEPGEESINSIIRETFEETGLQTSANQWQYIGKMESPEWHIDIYTTSHESKSKMRPTSDEGLISWFETNNLPNNMIDNLHWLIPLSAYKLKRGEFDSCLARYHS